MYIIKNHNNDKLNKSTYNTDIARQWNNDSSNLVAPSESVTVTLPSSARILISCNNIWKGVALVETIGSGGYADLQLTKLSTFAYWDIQMDNNAPKTNVIITNFSTGYDLRWHWTRI